MPLSQFQLARPRSMLMRPMYTRPAPPLASTPLPSYPLTFSRKQCVQASIKAVNKKLGPYKNSSTSRPHLQELRTYVLYCRDGLAS